jgi:hypothetical protein
MMHVAQRQRNRDMVGRTISHYRSGGPQCCYVSSDADVTDLWGNGDVQIGLKPLDELPYIMSLVRQSYERQMGDAAR